MEGVLALSHRVILIESIGYGTMLHLLLWLAVCCHLLLKPRDSRTSLLWIFFTSLFPLVGPCAYVLFGINTAPNKGRQKQFSDIAFQRLRRRSERTKKRVAAGSARPDSFLAALPDPALEPLHRVLERRCEGHHLLAGNQVELLAPAAVALDEIFKAIKEARHHIHLATYIFGDDALGRQLMELLVEKAHQGVQVRLMYDTFGSARAYLRLFFWRRRKVPNLSCVGFSQGNIFKRQFQLGLRNHRKLLIIDGRLAFTGGINFYDVYLPQHQRPAIIDYHFSVRGPLVEELQYTFLRDWFYMTDTPVEQLFTSEYYPKPDRCGEMAARLQNSGPTREESGATLDTMLAAINTARRQILIVTPYFIPPEPLMIALRQAAYRKVDIRILVPGSNNFPTLKLASRASYEQLLRAGVRIFERTPPFIHAKGMTIDDGVALIGSANIDTRSLLMNYETNLVVFDREFVASLKAALFTELQNSHEISYANWRQRSIGVKMVENFFNLFHPIA